MATRSLGQLTIDLVAKTFGFEQGMDKASRKAKSSGKEIEGALTGAFKTIGATIAGFVAGLATVDTAIRGFQQSVDFADRMDELSARFKISTETLSGWAYAAKLTGSDIEQLAGIIPKFSKNVADAADANSEMGKTFQALDISVKDATTGSLRSFQDLLPEIMDRFKGLNNETTETALAMQLFGKSGAEFLEFLNLGSDGLKGMEDRARELGIVIDTETAAKAAEFKDRVDDLRAATMGWFTQVSSALLPVLTDLTNEMTDFVKEGGDAKQIADSVASSIRDIADAIRFLGSVGDVFDRIRGGLVGLEKQGNAAFKALTGQAFFTGDSWGDLKAQYEEGAAYIDHGWKAMRDAQAEGAKQFSVQLIDPSEGFGDYKTQKRLEDMAKKYQEALDKLYGGGDKPTSAKKSAAQQEAERLFQAYDSMAASLDQQIALFGQTTEAAKYRYEVEFGSLVNLEPKLKNYLVYKAEELDALKDAAELRKEEEKLQKQELDRIEKGLQYGRELVAGLQFEIELMRMGNAERATAIQLRGMEAEAVQAYGEAIAGLNRQIEEQMQRTQIMDGFRDSFATFFEDTISGTKSVKDAFTDMLDDINRMILRRITENWVEQLFGGFGSTAGGSAGGNWFSMIAGWFSGGRANGGWAGANSIHEVNERGLEMATIRGRDYLLTGNSPVQITPNHRLDMGGGQNVTQNFYNPVMADRQADAQRQHEAAARLRMATARS